MLRRPRRMLHQHELDQHEHDALHGIVDLHALTTVHDGAELVLRCEVVAHGKRKRQVEIALKNQRREDDDRERQ